MNREQRRAAKRKHRKHFRGCSCSGIVRLSTVLVCSCGQEVDFDYWMPSSGLVGETRQVGCYCPSCDGDVEGLALIVDRADY